MEVGKTHVQQFLCAIGNVYAKRNFDYIKTPQCYRAEERGGAEGRRAWENYPGGVNADKGQGPQGQGQKVYGQIFCDSESGRVKEKIIKCTQTQQFMHRRLKYSVFIENY